MSDKPEAELPPVPIETGAPPTPQEATEAALHLAALSAAPLAPGRFRYATNDPHAQVAGWVFEATRRGLSGCPVWLRIFDGEIGALAVLHGFAGPGEMELLLLAEPGVLNRSTIRFLGSWIFERVGGEGLLRVVIRVPTAAVRLQGYARRAGFRHEGTSRDFFGPGLDASIWALTRSDAAVSRWYRRRGSAEPKPAPSDSSRQRLH